MKTKEELQEMRVAAEIARLDELFMKEIKLGRRTYHLKEGISPESKTHFEGTGITFSDAFDSSGWYGIPPRPDGVNVTFP